MTSTLPNFIRMGGRKIPVRVEPLGDLEGCYENGVITLDPGLAPTRRPVTLLHEWAHSVLEGLCLPEDIEERVCDALAPAIVDLVTQNPRLLAAIRRDCR